MGVRPTSIFSGMVVIATEVCPSLPNADACPNIGFQFTLDTKQLRNGIHRLGIRVVNDRGDSVTFPSAANSGIRVSVQNP